MKFQQSADLFPHTTLRIKAQAENFGMVRSRQELVETVKYAKEHNLPLTILGGGSNVAIIKDVVPGIVLKNLYIEKKIIKQADTYVDISVSSGYPIAKLVNELNEAGYEGLEHHLGLPGTVGGAIYMNSKWTNPVCYFGDPLLSAKLLDKDSNEKEVDRDYFEFAYDHSRLQETGEILLEAVFRLKKADPKELKKRSQESLRYRKETQPTGIFSSGCAFRNITEEERQRIDVHTTSAGNLIDKAGLKGIKVGSFIVSPVHANYIVNEGEGKPEDLVKLLNIIKNKVKEKFGIELREEVILI